MNYKFSALVHLAFRTFALLSTQFGPLFLVCSFQSRNLSSISIWPSPRLLHNCEVDHFVAFLFIFPVLPYPVGSAKTDTPELQRIVTRLLEDNVICPKIIHLRRDIISKMVAPGTDSYIPARLKDGIPIIPITQPSSDFPRCSVKVKVPCPIIGHYLGRL